MNKCHEISEQHSTAPKQLASDETDIIVAENKQCCLHNASECGLSQNRSVDGRRTVDSLDLFAIMWTLRDDPRMLNGASYLLRSLPQKQQKLTSYYWYYATQAMYHMQGDYWETWNEKTKVVLVETQEQSGGNAGSWRPIDNWEKSGGRVYATSIKLLMLEVYYRHLPLYDQLEF